MKPIFTKDESLKIAFRYINGESAIAIAKTLNVPHANIYYILRRYKVERRRPGRALGSRNPPGSVKVPPEARARILELDLQGYSHPTIATEFDITREYVRQICKEAGHVPRSEIARKRKADRLAARATLLARRKEERAVLAEIPTARIVILSQLWLTGKTIAQIAADLNTTPNCVGVQLVNARKRWPDMFPYRNRPYQVA